MTAFISLLAVGIILGLRRVRPQWPGLLIAVAICAAMTGFLHLDVATIGTRFGGIPHSLPAFDLAKMRSLLPDAFSLALLGAIESLLSAVVADGMSGRRHRSNCELVAQGIANIAAPIFGGMPVTGTIARTATNVRSGARSPISGILHALYVLLVMLLAAPLAGYIPLAALGAVLAIVAWNMAEKEDFAGLVRGMDGDTLVLLATFGLTIFVDLTLGIAVGVTLGAFLFLHRMAEAIEVKDRGDFLGEDRADDDHGDGANASDSETMVYKISGAFFFAATSAVSATLERIGKYPHAFVFDLSDVPLIDRTAARALNGFAGKLARARTLVGIAGARPDVERALQTAGLRRPAVIYAASVPDARRQLAAAREL
jgi:sulfate permease, SulP family